jgi:hypothetical protein
MNRPLLAAFVIASLAISQEIPRSYRETYKAWRTADPTLEQEAAEAKDLAARVEKVAQVSFRHGSDHGAFVRALAEERADNLEWLQNSGAVVELDLAPAAEMQAAVMASTNFVNNDIASFEKDSDRLILQLRQALEREKAALSALGTAISERQKALQKSNEALPGTEAARASAMGEYQRLYTISTNGTAQADREAAAWATYYQVLSEAPKMIEAGRAVLLTRDPGPAVVNGVRIMNPAKPIAPKPVVTATAPATTPTVPVTPGARFAGEWRYPVGGLFHGTTPETVELHVTEEAGQLTGLMSVRFKLPAGATEDPALIMTFRGDITAARNQTLEVETSDGAKGSIDLIPGPVAAQLEVNFLTQPRPDKIRSGNFLLERKQN